MSLSYRFEGDVVRLILTGIYTPREWFEVLERALGDPACPPPCAAVLLIDARDADSIRDRTPADRLACASLLASRGDRFGRWLAILTRDDLDFGMMRMANVLLEARGLSGAGFRSEGAALSWLAEMEIA